MAMSTRITALFVVFLVGTASGNCYNRCRFELCYSPVVYLQPSDSAITGPICDKWRGIKIGVANTGEAKVLVSRRKHHVFFKRISDIKPWGLKQRYSPSFFKSFSTRYYTHKHRYVYLAAIGHEVPQQNQLKFIRNRCIVLPIKHYQVLDKKKNVVDNVNNSHWKSCIAFRTK